MDCVTRTLIVAPDFVFAISRATFKQLSFVVAVQATKTAETGSFPEISRGPDWDEQVGNVFPVAASTRAGVDSHTSFRIAEKSPLASAQRPSASNRLSACAFRQASTKKIRVRIHLFYLWPVNKKRGNRVLWTNDLQIVATKYRVSRKSICVLIQESKGQASPKTKWLKSLGPPVLTRNSIRLSKA